jgi:hypothetical protein
MSTGLPIALAATSSLHTEAGFDTARETPWSRDLAAVVANSYFEQPPWNEAI